MKERPILFSAPMVRALLAGTKTQTRRVFKVPLDCSWYAGLGGEAEGWLQDDNGPSWWHVSEQRSPYGQPGDRLWVRETHLDLGGCCLYRADPGAEQERELVAPGQKWTPSIHMPRAASRISLEVTGVRVERLQDISEADARAEGIVEHQTLRPGTRACNVDGGIMHACGPVPVYRDLWDSINGPGAWDSNPWLWVVEFRRI